MGWRDDVKQQYEELRRRHTGESYRDFQKGHWLADLVRLVLREHADKVDAEYIRCKYPGIDPEQKARKAIGLAAKYCGMVGGCAAGAISAAEFSLIPTFGSDLPLVAPAVGGAVIADVTLTTRVQIRSIYDLSVIHGAPLLSDDVEDCMLILALAMGVSLGELLGSRVRMVTPGFVAYNARRILRQGLREGMVRLVARVGGTKLAKLITERTLMRLIVPGVSIPISIGLNYLFANQVLGLANWLMRRRGAVVRPLARLCLADPDVDRLFLAKCILVTVETAEHHDWSMGQMDALRHCQSALCLSDDMRAELDAWFDRGIEALLATSPELKPESVQHLVELLCVFAALYPSDPHDVTYSSVIGQVARRFGLEVDDTEVARSIRVYRRRLK